MGNLKEILIAHKLWVESKGKDGSRADLTRAYLTGANLTGANLTGAYLTRADLRGADLRRANLIRADLTRADLRGADLTRANLTRADLRGADLTRANLTEANLTKAKGLYHDPDLNLITAVAAAALAEGALNMERWHTCKTTHCIAGWAVTLHPDGKRLEENSSTYIAGRLLLGDEAAEHFFDSEEQAREYLAQFITKQ